MSTCTRGDASALAISRYAAAGRELVAAVECSSSELPDHELLTDRHMLEWDWGPAAWPQPNTTELLTEVAPLTANLRWHLQPIAAQPMGARY